MHKVDINGATSGPPTKTAVSSSTWCLCWTVATSISLPLGFLLLAIFSFAATLTFGEKEASLTNNSVEYSILDELKIGESGVYPNVAVATDAGICSKIGVSILRQGGSAVDAAITSLLCVGVVNLHSTGIGGGGFLLYYQAATKEIFAIDYREVAPLSARHDMYEGLEPTASTLGACRDFTFGWLYTRSAHHRGSLGGGPWRIEGTGAGLEEMGQVEVAGALSARDRLGKTRFSHTSVRQQSHSV